jgi:anaerobic ribonucleoside-triphosphate reductase activating protein
MREHDAQLEINIAGFMRRSYANGPGARAVVWVQGCPLGCPGCFNPHTHSFEPRRLVTVEELTERILKLEGIEGVTYSGGEPFAQAEALAKLSERLREQGLSIMSYSGYTIEQIRRSGEPAKLKLLSLLDILVDGPFVIAEKKPLLWRGSANQQVRFLTERYRHLAPLVDRQAQRMEVALSSDGELLMTGFPGIDEERRLRALLKDEFGLKLA